MPPHFIVFRYMKSGKGLLIFRRYDNKLLPHNTASHSQTALLALFTAIAGKIASLRQLRSLFLPQFTSTYITIVAYVLFLLGRMRGTK
jgi:hypothetical protein